MSNFKKTLQNAKMKEIKLRSPVLVSASTPLSLVLSKMRDSRRGCALIMDGKKICGIFTERDLLTRVIGEKRSLSTKIDKVMTPNPGVLSLESSVAEAIQLMSYGGYRHIPLVDEHKNVQGFVSVRDIMDYLAEHFPYEVFNLPPDPQQVSVAPEGA